MTSGSDSPVPPVVASPKPELRVLIVEDSVLDARVLVNLLKQGGWQVRDRRVDTTVALELALREAVWDLVLCDHNLPGFGSPEALRIVQASGQDLPFLIVSGDIEEGVAVAAMKSGAHDFLIKGKLARLVPAVQRELRDAAGRVAQRTAEIAMRESELRYRSVWENSTDAVLLIDGSGAIRFANPATRMVFGWDPAEMVGKPLSAVSSQATNDGGDWADWAAGPRIWETQARRPDGTEVSVEVARTEMQMGDQRWRVAFVRDITDRLRAEAEIRRNRESLAAAREIQLRLFPQASPVVPGFELAGRSIAAEAAGGDYFDFLALPGNAVGLVMADVSGHGVGSALLMAEARAYLRLLARDVGDPGLLITAANRALADDLGQEQYITLFLGRLEPGSRRLVFSNAGHPAALVLGVDGEIRATLRRNGPPLGRRPDQPHENGPEVTLRPGELLLIVTDGVDEATDAAATECFGMERAAEVVRKHASLSAEAIVAAVCQAVREYCAPESPADDVTVLVVKALPAAE
jgi:PAS domain S-box-containing protein